MTNPDNLKWYVDPQWYAIFITLSIGVLSFFKEYFFQAKVDFDFKVVSPDCHKTKISYNFSNGSSIQMKPCYYYRLRVSSKNRVAPEKLELMVVKKYKKQGDDFILDETFLPMSLLWSHYGEPVLSHIAPKLFKFCDFGSIIHPTYQELVLSEYGIGLNLGDVALSLELEKKPFTGSHILKPGIYAFQVVLSGKNTKKISKYFKVDLRNYWDDDEAEMLNRGLQVSELRGPI